MTISQLRKKARGMDEKSALSIEKLIFEILEEIQMATIKEIYDYINEIAPFNTQLSFDNAGFLIGDINREVSNLGFCLDVTNEIICKAIENKTELIITHHPVIFNKLNKIFLDIFMNLEVPSFI